MSGRKSILDKGRRSFRQSVLSDTLTIEQNYLVSLKPVHKYDEWSIYTGLEIHRKNQVIAFMREKCEQGSRNLDNKLHKGRISKQRDNKLFFPSFCCKEIYRGGLTFNGKAMEVIVFQKIGVSIFQLLDSFEKVTSDILHLMILLFIQFIKKVHLNSLNLVSLSFKNMFLGWENPQTPRIFLCNTSCLKINLQSNIIGNNLIVSKIGDEPTQERKKGRTSIGVKPSGFGSPRRTSRVSVNKGKIVKRGDVQIVLTKLTEIENDWKVAFQSEREKQCFELIIKYLAKESVETKFQENEKYDAWLLEIEKMISKAGIDVIQANKKLFKKIKTLKSDKNGRIFIDSALLKEAESKREIRLNSHHTSHDLNDEDYDSDMSQKMVGLGENLRRHVFSPFERKKY